MNSVMILRLIGLFAVLAVLFGVAETTRRLLGHSNETSRKILHVVRGIFAVLVPFLANMHAVIVIETLFIVGVLLAEKTHFFGWMWHVGRKSYGELFYPVGVIITALLAPDKWVYAVAILQLALADAAAAMIGKHFGAKSIYKVFGQKKSVAGSTAFFAVSVTILILCAQFASSNLPQLSALTILGMAIVLTLTEAVSVFGSDNLMIPIVAVALLTLL